MWSATATRTSPAYVSAWEVRMLTRTSAGNGCSGRAHISPWCLPDEAVGSYRKCESRTWGWSCLSPPAAFKVFSKTLVSHVLQDEQRAMCSDPQKTSLGRWGEVRTRDSIPLNPRVEYWEAGPASRDFSIMLIGEVINMTSPSAGE